MSEKTISIAQNAELPAFTNRFFILTDSNDYVVGMMVAINKAEADEYESQQLTEVSNKAFESLGQDSKYVDGQVVQGVPRISDLTEGSASALKAALFREATDRIQTLQDAMDLGMSEECDDAILPKWKKYRVLLNRVDASKAPNIEWPLMPEDI